MLKKFIRVLTILIIVLIAKHIFVAIYYDYNNQKMINTYYNNPSKYNDDSMILDIPSINLKRHVVRAKDNFSNLDNNIVYYKNNDYNKTIILFAHSGMGYGTFFNRIDELENGDMCYLYIKNSKITYKLTKLYVISYKDTSILNTNKEGKLLLITCVKNDSKKRLVIELDKKCQKMLKNKQKTHIF